MFIRLLLTSCIALAPTITEARSKKAPKKAKVTVTKTVKKAVTKTVREEPVPKPRWEFASRTTFVVRRDINPDAVKAEVERYRLERTLQERANEFSALMNEPVPDKVRDEK